MTTTKPKKTLEKIIGEKIDFLCDHWGADDKAPFQFGGWRNEIIAELVALLKQIVEDKVIKKDQKQVNLYHIAEYREIQAQNNLRDDQRQAL